MTKDEALNLALEALEWSYGGEPIPTKEAEAIKAIRQALADQKGNEMTDKLKAAAEMALDFLESGMPSDTYGMDKEQHQVTIFVLRQALAELDRGAWSDVENATKWVDDLRGDDPDTDTKHIGEIVEAHGLIAVSIPKMPPVGTKLYAHSLLNQTCCGCGRSGGYALYCGWCWNKGN